MKNKLERQNKIENNETDKLLKKLAKTFDFGKTNG